MMLDPPRLRRNPQLAALDLLIEATETASVALCAAHPAVEHPPNGDPQPPLEHLANTVLERASALLDAIDRYHALLQDLECLERGPPANDDFGF